MVILLGCRLLVVAQQAASSGAHAATAATAAPLCGRAAGHAQRDTLFFLDPSDPHLRMVDAADAAACCEACWGNHSSAPPCSTWSFTHAWPGTKDCHLSARAPLRHEPRAGSTGATDAVPPPPPAPVHGAFSIDMSDASALRQTIEGIGFEIQADSIGSGTDPAVTGKISGVPHDLVPSERARLSSEMLAGFRTCRLALGLYVRGLDAPQQHIIQRWPTQMAELEEMQRSSGISGFDVEYWSPAPYWKGPTLQAFTCKKNQSSSPRWSTANNASFVEAWSDAMQADAVYLQRHGLRIENWGLQNEPENCPVYAGILFTTTEYRDMWAAVGPKIKAVVPGVRLEAGSSHGCAVTASALFADPVASKLIDSWTYHTGGQPSASAMHNFSCGDGKPVWVNEWEYFQSLTPGRRFNLTAGDTINLAATVVNWFVFSDSPKFSFLHALKPSYNVEAEGFGLGFWRPNDDNSTQQVPLKKGHWRYNNKTWNALGGFVRHMPWDVKRITVKEDVVRADQRIFAFVTAAAEGKGGPRHPDTPAGRLGVVLVNLAPSATFTARVAISGLAEGGGGGGGLNGHRYTASEFGTRLGAKSASSGALEVTVPPLSVEFWVQY